MRLAARVSTSDEDQSLILPVFYAGELIAWVATIIHEGENGAKEPGGMRSSSESAYDDGFA